MGALFLHHPDSLLREERVVGLPTTTTSHPRPSAPGPGRARNYPWLQAGSAGNPSGVLGLVAARHRPHLSPEEGCLSSPRPPTAPCHLRGRLQPVPQCERASKPDTFMSWPALAERAAALQPPCRAAPAPAPLAPHPRSHPHPDLSVRAPAPPEPAQTSACPSPPFYPGVEGLSEPGPGVPRGWMVWRRGSTRRQAKRISEVLTALLPQEHQLKFSQRVPKISPCGHGAGSRDRERRKRRSEGAGRGEEGEGRRPAVREPEGEGLAARVPDSPAASRPRPAAACPVAAAAAAAKGGGGKGGGGGRLRCVAAGGARCSARSALWTPRRGAGRAGRRDGARGGGALASRATRPPPASLRRQRLRSARPPASDVMRGPRRCGAVAAGGEGASVQLPGARSRKRENRFAVP